MTLRNAGDSTGFGKMAAASIRRANQMDRGRLKAFLEDRQLGQNLGRRGRRCVARA
jgi:hypothetical protein